MGPIMPYIKVKVDTSITNLIRYINGKYCHRIIPHSSCEGHAEGDKAYISVYPKSLEDLDEFILDAFGNEQERLKYMLTTEYDYNGFSRMFTIRWYHCIELENLFTEKYDDFLKTDNREGY
jgi:hypothetical protein